MKSHKIAIYLALENKQSRLKQDDIVYKNCFHENFTPDKSHEVFDHVTRCFRVLFDFGSFISKGP